MFLSLLVALRWPVGAYFFCGRPWLTFFFFLLMPGEYALGFAAG